MRTSLAVLFGQRSKKVKRGQGKKRRVKRGQAFDLGVKGELKVSGTNGTDIMLSSYQSNL